MDERLTEVEVEKQQYPEWMKDSQRWKWSSNSTRCGGKTQRGGSGEATVPGVEERLREVEVEKQEYPVWMKDSERWK